MQRSRGWRPWRSRKQIERTGRRPPPFFYPLRPFENFWAWTLYDFAARHDPSGDEPYTKDTQPLQKMEPGGG